ncbi:hypothetical protein [Methanobrevibacter smithii]|nr:hypothetical protein [Methanobrevibacter smithii]
MISPDGSPQKAAFTTLSPYTLWYLSSSMLFCKRQSVLSNSPVKNVG